MKILMTGATGFLGRPLATALTQSGHSIVVLSRDPQKAARAFDVPVETFAWNAEHETPPARAWEGIDAVIHLAGEGVADRRWSEEQKKKIRDSRILGTRNLVDGIRELSQRPKHFICASAIGYYGDGEDRTIDENAPPGSDFLAEVCVAWEAEARKAEALGLRTAMVRTGLVIGRDGGALAKMLPAFRAALGGKLGSGKQWMSWIHLSDLIGIYCFIVDNPSVSGPVNATAPKPVTNFDFTKTLGRVLHRPTVFGVPAIALKIALGELAQVLLTGQRVLPRRAGAAGYEFRFAELEPALRQEASKKKRPSRSESITREQFLNRPVEEVFAFFSSEKNLEKITPPWLNFRVVGKTPGPLRSGTEIHYRLKVHALPMRWSSLIDEWEPNRGFVDHQLKGPYVYWHHTHRFHEQGGGTLVTDHVRYAVPGGKLGRFLLGRWIRKDVETIFNFRTSQIAQLFS